MNNQDSQLKERLALGELPKETFAMRKHFGLSIKVGFESQHVLHKPWADYWYCNEFNMLDIRLACLGIYLTFNWWRNEA